MSTERRSVPVDLSDRPGTLMASWICGPHQIGPTQMSGAEPESLRVRYELEGAQVSRYDASSPWDRRYHQVRFDYIASALVAQLRDGDRFLDVGCGTGEYLGLAGSRSAESTGLDLSYTYCRRALSDQDPSHVVQASASGLPFADRAFDVVLCSEVIEHVPAANAASIVDELYRVAGRAVIVTTPNVRAAVRRLARRVRPELVERLDAEVGHINLLSAEGLLALLSRAGWRLTAVGVRHVTPPVVGEQLRMPEGLSLLAGWVERAADRIAPRSGNTMMVVARRVERR